MHVAQEWSRFWLNDMHTNKDLKRDALRLARYRASSARHETMVKSAHEARDLN
jgi:hypothetical protein